MHDLVLFRDALYVKHQQASTPCNVTAVGHNAQHSDTDMTAPSRSPTHPVSANSWGIQGGGGVSAEQGESGWTGSVSDFNTQNITARKLHILHK